MALRVLLLGLFHGGLVLVLELVAQRPLGFVASGTRAQATGVALSTMFMIGSGLLLGVRSRANPDGPTSSMLTPWRPAPWPAVWATSAWTFVLGLLGFFLGVPGFIASPEAAGPGGMARAMLGANAVLLPAVLLVGLGAMLGANCRRRTASWVAVGLLVFGASVATTSWLARFVSYEPGLIAVATVAGVGFSAWLVGFVVAWAAGRLAFVELYLTALVLGYALYLTFALGPTAWTAASNLPEEQVLLALALFPTVAMSALMMVGGSLGFLLHGGGRFDPSFAYEGMVAQRYLRAHRRDGFVGTVTVIAVVGICLGVMALIVVLSIMSGFENDLKTKIVGAHAHVEVNKHGDDFTEYADIEARVGDIEGVLSAGAYVFGDAMISTDAGLSGTLIKGIDPAASGPTRDLRRIMEKGELLNLLAPEKIPGARPAIDFPPPPIKTSSTGTAGAYELAVPVIRDAQPLPGNRVLPGIVIGRELSRTLRAYVGDVVKVVSPASEEIGPLGPTPKLNRFRVAGVFYSGMYEYDAKFTYIEMRQAQRFFGMRKRATGVELKVADIDDTARISEEVRRRVGGEPYTVKDWRAMNKELFSALLLEKIAMFVALGMIVMVASFLIIAVLVMIVLQRKKEIAVIKSLGASDASIMKIFVVEGLILGVGGAVLGLLVGIGICAFLENFGVKLDERIFYIERLPVVLDWVEVSVIAAAAITISYLATIYPAMTAAQHPPVEGLRDD
ncbi:MAG: ABC transporter permease [Deltaproteobacteria bacterium]|jgi:ABC-type lipoprotein release transport system permease subunit|nr:ABC transporter permease [Deltaproteobacteria bacterium]